MSERCETNPFHDTTCCSPSWSPKGSAQALAVETLLDFDEHHFDEHTHLRKKVSFFSYMWMMWKKMSSLQQQLTAQHNLSLRVHIKCVCKLLIRTVCVKCDSFLILCPVSDSAAGSSRWPTEAQPSQRRIGWALSPPRRLFSHLPSQSHSHPAPVCHSAHSQWILFHKSFSGAAWTPGQKSQPGTGRWRRKQRKRALPAAELSTSQLQSRQSTQHQQHYQ